MKINLYGGFIVDIKKYTIEIGFSLNEWGLYYKNTNTIKLIHCGPFSLYVFDNEQIDKKLEQMMSETFQEDKDDAISGR